MTFYPSVTARLLVRFEELADQLRQAPDARQRLGVRSDIQDALKLSPLLRPGGRPAQMPPATAGALDDLTHVVEVAPRRTEWAQNSFRIADDCKITFDFRDFPFDPRVVRAAAVELYLGALPPSRVVGAVGSGQVSRFGPADGPPVYVGVVDHWISNHTEDGEHVELHTRDLTALFLDTPVNSTIDTNKPLDEILADILAVKNAPWEGIGLEIRTADGEEQQRIELESVPEAKVFTRVRQGADGQTPTMTPPGANLNWWDVITILCQQAGVIPIVELDREQRQVVLAVTTPKALIGNLTQRPRRFVYGRNLKELQFERKIGGLNVPPVVAKSWDPDRKRLLVAQSPKDLQLAVGQQTPATPNTVAPSGDPKLITGRVFLLRGIKDQDRLQRIADSLREQIGRQELLGNLTTADILSFTDETDTNNPILADSVAAAANADLGLSLLKLRSGDPIEVLVAADVGGTADKSAYTEILGLSESQLVERLKGIGYADGVARTLSRYIKSDGLQTVFRVRNVRTVMDNNTGYQVTLDFCNFYEPREVGALRAVQVDPRSARTYRQPR